MGNQALIADVFDPHGIHRTCPGATLASKDHPVDTREIESGKGTEKWLKAQEPDGCRNRAEMVDSEPILAVLDADAHPDIRWPIELRSDLLQALRSLRQNLIGVLWSVSHDIKDSPNELQRNVRMEQVTHRVHKDDAGLSPRSREVEDLGVERELEARARRARIAIFLVLPRTHRLEPLGESQRVAVVAPRRHTITSGRGVPGGLGPLDAASISHFQSLNRAPHSCDRTRPV